jgi:hypothetical protein
MPIHYEKNDEHIVRISIDRPEARNALDLYHFRDLAAAWRTFKDDADAWVAIAQKLWPRAHVDFLVTYGLVAPSCSPSRECGRHAA